MEKGLQNSTLDNFTKQKIEWKKKVRDELAMPYGIFAMGETA